MGCADAFQLELKLDDERRQHESNRRYWQQWLDNIAGDLDREPARIRAFYAASTFRIEPVGIAYLWPVTG